MTETLIEPASRTLASAPPGSCEVSSLPEAARAFRMMDRELALLRLEHQLLRDRVAKIQTAALAGLFTAGAGLGLGLTVLLGH